MDCTLDQSLEKRLSNNKRSDGCQDCCVEKYSSEEKQKR